MSPRSAFGEEMDKRRAHLEALPAYQLREDLEALKRSFYIFNTNATELASHVGRFLASTQLSQQLSDNYVNELVRLLHNYLTSVTSLIDSQRVVMRHRWPYTRGNAGICDSCGRPMPSKDDLQGVEKSFCRGQAVDEAHTLIEITFRRRNYW